MLICVLLAIFSVDSEDIILNSGKVSAKKLRASVFSIQSGWYFIKSSDSNGFAKFSGDFNLSINSSNIVSDNWARIFIEKDMMEKMSANTNFLIVKADNSAKKVDIPDGAEQILIEGDLSGSDLGIKPIFPGFYSASPSKFQTLSQNSLVKALSFTKFPSLFNRWVSGTIQSPSFPVVYSGNFLIPLRPIHKRGICGQNEVAAVIDTGVDSAHCFFYDPNNKYPVNATNFAHRKIVRYQAYGDSYDIMGGHGSHVSGCLLGKSVCNECSGSMYNGQAPEAKLFIVDAASADSPYSLSISPDLSEVMSLSSQLGVSVFSNSWGYDTDQPIFRSLFDNIAYDFPNITFFFAVGNSRKYNDIKVPADSKNVIGVTSCSKPEASALENGFKQVFILVAETRSFQCEVSTASKSVLELLRTDPIPSYSNLSVENREVQVIINDDQLNESARIILAQKGSTLKSSKVPIILLSSEALKQISNERKVSLLASFKSEASGPSFTISGLSSKGPTISGLLKPELSAPGDGILSAKACSKSCSTSSLMEKYGTSIATPVVAGAGILARQYFKEGWYPSGRKNENNSIIPSSSLIKSVLVNSAGPLSGHSTNPNVIGGFGIPHLTNCLVFDDQDQAPPLKEYGLRIVDRQEIRSGSTLKSVIQISCKESPLMITISWLDPPLDSDSTRLLFADLDLFLILPNGSVIYGNQQENGQDEMASTSERIIIPGGSLQVGTFTICVKCSKLPIDNPIYFSMVVNAGFDHLNYGAIKFEKTSSCEGGCGNGTCKNSACICGTNFTGYQCQNKVSKLDLNESKSFSIQGRSREFFYFDYPKDIQGGSINISIVTESGILALVDIGVGQIPKYGGDSIISVPIKVKTQITIRSNSHPSLKTGSTVFISIFLATHKASSFIIGTNSSELPDYFTPSHVVTKSATSQATSIIFSKQFMIVEVVSGLFVIVIGAYYIFRRRISVTEVEESQSTDEAAPDWGEDALHPIEREARSPNEI